MTGQATQAAARALRDHGKQPLSRARLEALGVRFVDDEPAPGEVAGLPLRWTRRGEAFAA